MPESFSPCRSAVGRLRHNLGTIAAECDRKPSTTTQERARRIKITLDFVTDCRAAVLRRCCPVRPNSPEMQAPRNCTSAGQFDLQSLAHFHARLAGYMQPNQLPRFRSSMIPVESHMSRLRCSFSAHAFSGHRLGAARFLNRPCDSRHIEL